MRGVFHHFLCCILAGQLWATAEGLNEKPLINKRAPSGFQGMRGKKFDSYMDNSFLSDPNLNEFESEIEGMEKRAPAMGFQGMRGKKLYENQLRNFYQYKRIPMGFHGMRGKKDMQPTLQNGYNKEFFPQISDDQEFDIEPNAYLIDNSENYNKRAPAMGFQGMRGKKDIEETKRAPAEGFFGMRGKKQPGSGSGFFGMRGKKYPYEFRGKFVGVRGKKLLTETGSNENEIDETDNHYFHLLHDNDNATNLNHLMYLLKENNDRSNDVTWTKRKQQGFFGVRGKKEFDN